MSPAVSGVTDPSVRFTFVPLGIGVRIIRKCNGDFCDAWQFVLGSLDRRRQAHIAGLSFRPEHRFEALVDVIDDLCLRTEVRGDLNHGAAVLRSDTRARLVVGRDVGSAEAIDGLLRIAHQEERAPSKPRILPADRRFLGGDGKNDCGLDAVGVLEFIDEDVPESSAERRSDGFVPADQVVRHDEQVVEVQHCGFLLAPCVGGDDAVEHRRKRTNQSVRDLASSSR